jgi:hypothetical protein
MFRRILRYPSKMCFHNMISIQKWHFSVRFDPYLKKISLIQQLNIWRWLPCTLRIARHSPKQWYATWICHFCWICPNMYQDWLDSIELRRFLSALKLLKHKRHGPSAVGNSMAHLDGQWGERDSFPGCPGWAFTWTEIRWRTCNVVG